MAVRPLCVEPHPSLRAPAHRVVAFTRDLRRLVDDMIETMYAHEGIGLAAPQIGRELQVFVANPSRERGKELIMVNPDVEWSAGRTSIVEGCLSVPTVWAKVRRAANVRMKGADAAGVVQTVTADGLLAIVLQHEFDHLHGRLFIDRLSWWRRLLTRKHMR